MLTVDFLRLPSGRCPIQEFLLTLDRTTLAKVEKLVEALRQDGWLQFPYARKMQGNRDLWEMRIISSGRAIRIFYAYVDHGRALVISGFEKRSQKTPGREIERALHMLRTIREGR